MSAVVQMPAGQIVTIDDQQVTCPHALTQMVCRAALRDGRWQASSIPDHDVRIATFLAREFNGTVTHKTPSVQSAGAPGTIY
jgi:hypothetical protein